MYIRAEVENIPAMQSSILGECWGDASPENFDVLSKMLNHPGASLSEYSNCIWNQAHTDMQLFVQPDY